MKKKKYFFHIQYIARHYFGSAATPPLPLPLRLPLPHSLPPSSWTFPSMCVWARAWHDPIQNDKNPTCLRGECSSTVQRGRLSLPLTRRLLYLAARHPPTSFNPLLFFWHSGQTGAPGTTFIPLVAPPPFTHIHPEQTGSWTGPHSSAMTPLSSRVYNG